jgi:hypothetical protein
MVGVLTDKQGIPVTTAIQPTPTPSAAAIQASATRARPRRVSTRRLAIELTEDQIQSIRAQVSGLEGDRPTQVVLYVDGRRIGELSVQRLHLDA